MAPFADFVWDKLPFPQPLQREVDLWMGPNCSYVDWQVFGLIIFGYLCGYKRLSHFGQLSRDTTVQKLLGLEGPIDENTLARRLKQAGYKIGEAGPGDLPAGRAAPFGRPPGLGRVGIYGR